MLFFAETIFNVLPSSSHYWIALSGGLDSVVLLHMFRTYAAEKKLSYTAAHIHHGWSNNADEWEIFCEALCKNWNVNFQSQRIDAKVIAGESREAKAREMRYAALGSMLSVGDCLLTAHHQDDQVETVLLQLFRGAGVKGLAAIPQVQSFNKGMLYRPLLSLSRAEILAYAKQHELSWVEDESNADIAFKRNFIRHQLLPTIQQEWSGIRTTLSRSARLCAEADELLSEVAMSDLQSVQGLQINTLSIGKLLQLTVVRQRNVIRYWLLQLGYRLPSERKLLQLQQNVLMAKEDAMPVLKWQGAEVRRYRDDLYIMLPLDESFDVFKSFQWDLRKTLVLSQLNKKLSAREVFFEVTDLLRGPVCCHPDCSQAHNSGLPPTATPQPKFDSTPENSLICGIHQTITITDLSVVEVRFRQGGEKIVLPNRQGHQSLKKLFQEWSVPPWQRDRIPLIYVGNKLACVLGYAVSAEFSVKNNEEGWEISVASN